MELWHLFHSLIANTVSNSTQDKMEAKEFRKVGKELIDFIADHIEGVSLHLVVPSVKPGIISIEGLKLFILTPIMNLILSD